MWRQEIKEQRQDTTLGFYYLRISTPDHIQTATDYFVFCIHTKIISFGSKHNSTCFSQNLFKAQQNRAEPFGAASASAATFPRTGAWDYSDIDKRRAEQMDSPGSSNAPSHPQHCSPAGTSALTLYHCRALLRCCWKPHGQNCHSLVQAQLVLSRGWQVKPWAESWERGSITLLTISYFTDASHPEKSTLFLLGALKRLAQEVLLATAFELFIPGSSPAISDTHSPIASVGFKYLTLNIYAWGEWQPRSLFHSHIGQSTVMGNTTFSFPVSSSLEDPVPSDSPRWINIDKASSSSLPFKIWNPNGATDLMMT